ncbi:tRNA modification GTPase MnmE-like [Triplophysa rosa]|uniref:tRNA modification GTPase MnmE-like n=1 Tax=Triplophysa rosa TaxID=992332 RepID=UPI002545E769|nr:tRNA modification GTPase MnmE-like [Triplophysa rosa]
MDPPQLFRLGLHDISPKLLSNAVSNKVLAPTLADAETIYALSSGQGKAGIAVIRISGPDVRGILSKITRKNAFQPRLFFTSEIFDPFKEVLIDFSLVVYFSGPDSFTGENVGELHIHGGYSVIKSALEMLGKFPNTRLAYPGEFTRRAFANNKFDLTGAEAIADLLNAETEIQRLQALGQMSGNLSKFCFKWKEDLVKALSFQEALIDFSFEDIPENVEEEVNSLIKSIYDSISGHLEVRSGEKIRDGLSVVILGEPNVGKSSLMNKLTNTDSAIVSSIAGTTRDIIEVRIDLFGVLINFFDTAGIRRNSSDPIEQIGIDRARKKAQIADIKIFICSPNNLKLNDELAHLGRITGEVDIEELLDVIFSSFCLEAEAAAV